MDGRLTSTRCTNSKLVWVEIGLQVVDPVRIGTLGGQSSQSKAYDNWPKTLCKSMGNIWETHTHEYHMAAYDIAIFDVPKLDFKKHLLYLYFCQCLLMWTEVAQCTCHRFHERIQLI